MKRLPWRLSAVITAVSLSARASCCADRIPASRATDAEMADWFPRFGALDFLRPNAPVVVRTWSSAGASDNWSDAANWQGALVPMTGEEVLFGTAGGGGNSLLDFALTLSAFRFQAAVLPLYIIHIGNGA